MCFFDFSKIEFDKTLPFNIKNIPKDIIKSYEEQKELKKKFTHPTSFVCKNNTGIFEVSIYLDNYYRVIIDASIITNKCFLFDTNGISIEKDGKVYYYKENYSAKKRTKTNTGFILDEEKVNKINDFIAEMKIFSQHLRDKYYKSK